MSVAQLLRSVPMTRIQRRFRIATFLCTATTALLLASFAIDAFDLEGERANKNALRRLEGRLSEAKGENEIEMLMNELQSIKEKQMSTGLYSLLCMTLAILTSAGSGVAIWSAFYHLRKARTETGT